MSQQTMSQLASLSSRPDPAADTLTHYQALPVAHHQLEEATYESEALGVDDIVGWAASLDPSPDVIHIDMRSPTRISYLGGRGNNPVEGTAPPTPHPQISPYNPSPFQC